MYFLSGKTKDSLVTTIIKARKAFENGQRPEGRRLTQIVIDELKAAPSFRELTDRAEKLLKEEFTEVPDTEEVKGLAEFEATDPEEEQVDEVTAAEIEDAITHSPHQQPKQNFRDEEE